MLMILVTPRLLVAVTVLLTVTVVVSGLQTTSGEKEEMILHPYKGGEDMEESTWTFIGSVPEVPTYLTRYLKHLMPFDWLLFNQTNSLLKQWRLVAVTHPEPWNKPLEEGTPNFGEAHGRVEPTYPVPPRMELSTWNFDNNYAGYKQSDQSILTFLSTNLVDPNDASYEWILFHQGDPLLKRSRLVITSRPVMMNIQSVGVQQNLSEPDMIPGEVSGQVYTIPPMKIPEIDDTMAHFHQENEQQIAKTGDAVNSAYQMKVEENKSKIKLVRPYPLERNLM